VQSCLNRDEKKRPTAEQLLQHPWLQDEADISDVPFADTIVQRLQRYGLYGRFRQVALKALMQSIAEQDGESSQQFRDMRRVFEQMDRNADGRVTYSELKAALQSGHFQLSPSEVEQLAEQLDSQHSGTIDWSEWVAAMADWRSVSKAACFPPCSAGCATCSPEISAPPAWLPHCLQSSYPLALQPCATKHCLQFQGSTRDWGVRHG
jgi:calcium-dependent protein kinase